MPATTGVYPERSRRAPTHLWRGRPRPRKQPLGWRSHFGNRFVGHVHSSLTRNSAPTHSGIGDGGRGPTRSMSTKAPPLTKYRYRRRLPHLQKADAAIFVTFCTGGRRVLPEVARDLVLEHCLREAGVARAPSPAKWLCTLFARMIIGPHDLANRENPSSPSPFSYVGATYYSPARQCRVCSRIATKRLSGAT